MVSKKMNLRAFVFHPQIDTDERPEKRKMLESEFNFKSHYLWLKGFSMSEGTAVNNLVNSIEEKINHYLRFSSLTETAAQEINVIACHCLTLFEAIDSLHLVDVLKILL